MSSWLPSAKGAHIRRADSLQHPHLMYHASHKDPARVRTAQGSSQPRFVVTIVVSRKVVNAVLT